MKLPRFTPLPGFSARRRTTRIRRNPLSASGRKFLDALQDIAGQNQLVYMGPFIFVGDRKGGVLGQLELGLPRHEADKTVRLSFIAVEPRLRQQGQGTALMRMLVAAADAAGLDMDLNISPNTERGDTSPQMSARQLQRFYAKFGFISVSGRQWKDMRRVR